MLSKQSRLWLKYLKNYFARVTMIPRLPASSLMHRYLYLHRKKSNSDLGHLCTQVQKRIERKKELHLSQPLFPQKLMHTLPRVCQVGLCSASPLCSPRGCLSRFSVCFTLCRSLLRGHHYRSDLNTGVMKEKKVTLMENR